jgi:hypothetical protein
MERYQPYHQLLRLSRAREVRLVADDPDSPVVLVWRVGKGMQVGVLREIAELLAATDRPTDDFGRELTNVLREWALRYPTYQALGTINIAGVWGGEMESVTTMRVSKMWERHQAQQRARIARALQIEAYAVEIANFLTGQGPAPNARSRAYNYLRPTELETIAGKVQRGLQRHGANLDLGRIGLHKL